MANILLQYDTRSTASGSRMHLSGAAGRNDAQFEARILKPEVFRLGLLTLGQLIKTNYEDLTEEEWLERVLDPVVGIHPDGVSFEAFTQDCSAMGWIHFDNSVFDTPLVRRTGTTNIDYSEGLERFLRGLHAQSRVDLSVGTAQGVAMSAGKARHHERRIELPEGWLDGFGELHAGMLQARWSIPISKGELFSIQRASTRSMRGLSGMRGRALVFEVRPGEAIRIVVQPLKAVIPLRAKADESEESMDIRVYGRRRLELLATLIPHLVSAKVHLLGDTRPTYWELELPGMRMVLAMSSFGSRKFTRAVSERLRGATLPDEALADRAAALLADAELLSFEDFAMELDIPEASARGVGVALCRRGLAVAEPAGRGLRWRPVGHLAFAATAAPTLAREKSAGDLVQQGRLDDVAIANREGLLTASATCVGTAGRYDLSCQLLPDGTFERAACTCAWMKRQGSAMVGGPCKHLLALRALALAGVDTKA